MEVVLQKDYPTLGYVGDKVRVRRGFARNYLIPRGIAVEMTSRNARMLRHRMTQIEAKRAKLKEAAIERGKAFEGMILEFHLRIGEKGKSFGSISVRDIEQALKEKNVEVDRKQLRLLEPIKAGGDYGVEVKLHSEVVVPIVARVIVERVEKAAAPQADKAERGGRKSKGRRRDRKAEDSSQAEVEATEAQIGATGDEE